MHRRITSEDNAGLRLVRKLKYKKHRDAEGRFLIEGSNLVREALEKGISFDAVFLSEDMEGDALTEALAERTDLCLLHRGLYEKISDAENGSGFLAIVRKPRCSAEELAERLREEDNLLVLDRLQDPGNVGTMIRTAASAGYAAVLVVKGTVDLYSPKVLRATAGMIFNIPVLFAEDAEHLAMLVETLGKRLVVTDPAKGVPYYRCDLAHGIALVIGNEGNGISSALMAKAAERVTIPMHGGVESLNAAVSAALLMYEAVRGETDER